VRFGLFPALAVDAAAKDGWSYREFSLALMECAKADGGMRA
jgi:hypothetical protein